MTLEEQINAYILSLPAAKIFEMKELHSMILKAAPQTRLWFFDGTNTENKVVANPNIGYGFHVIEYADGKTREWFQVGISANKTGISVYLLGIKDKKFLIENYADTIGKATVTGYCIKFKSIKDINLVVLEDAITNRLSFK